MEKIKIAFVGQFYPIFMGRYILEALLRRPDVDVFSIGPFTGRNIPWKGGMVLPEKYVRTPDLPLPANPMSAVFGFIVDQLPWTPDLWLEVNSTLTTVGRPPGLYAVVGTDPHVIQYNEQRAKADHFFCMQKPYMQNGDHWLPYGYDPIWHAASPIAWEDRELNVALCGLQYPHRMEFFNAVRQRGHPYFFDTGPAYDDARAIYHNTKIGINIASKRDTTARVFEVMAMGLLPLFNRVPDLCELFEDGRDFVGFQTVSEAINFYDYALAHPMESIEIIANARTAVEPHTWDARVEQILKTVGLLNEEE